MNATTDFAIAARPLAPEAAGDYAHIRRIVQVISERWRDQPSVEEIAEAASLTPTETHHLFRRWCGLTPKAFLQAVTLDAAKRLLSDQATLLDATYELGLSGPGRLHDLFVTHEAMTPAQWRSGGQGLVLRYGFHPSPFGEALVVVTDRGLAGLGWVDEKPGPSRAADTGKPAPGREGALDDMRRRWPAASFVPDETATASYAARIFDPGAWKADQPLRVVLIGTDFEVRVWEGLLSIPLGRATTYGDLASRIGKPGAARAVGAAVGRNPISFVVPCHRVIGKSGDLTGYHWGITRKRAILGWEAGCAAA